ncbi:MAG: YtxH domain-containing protein [Acidobacteriales bacterium]|nr:YtxH domain-containing protein [Terriglobales bacterium]
MKSVDKNDIFKALIGAGLYLLDPVRDRLAGRMDDVADRAQDTYEEATSRLDRASRAIRGEDSNAMGSFTALLIGVGIGVGVGMLLAPASGEETRNNIAGKVQDVSDRVRGQVQEVTDRVRSQAQDVTDRVRSQAQDVTDRVRTQFSGDNDPQGAGTGTYGGV